MKITDVRCAIFRFELDVEMMDSRNRFPSRTTILVRIDTDEGISGFGESMSSGVPSEITKKIIEEMIKPYVDDEEPLRTELLWEKFYQGTMQLGRRGLLISAYSGVDQALWDIIGKKMNSPVYKLLGGFRDELEVYASAGFYGTKKKLEDLVREMKGYQKKGFKTMKMKIGRLNIEEDLKRVKSVREAIGSGTNLIVDANNAYTVPEATRMAKELSKHRVLFFEEPLQPDNINGYSKLIHQVEIPISSGEIEFTKYGFRELISNEAIDIIQPDASRSGGLTECKKIIDMADAWHIPAVPHAFSSGCSLLANMHLACSSKSCFGPEGGNKSWYKQRAKDKRELGGLLELDVNENPLRTKLAEKIKIRRGTAKIPEEPGLGLNLDEKTLEKYRITKEPLLK